MNRTLIAAVMLVSVPPGAALAQTPDPATILDNAARAIVATSTLRYEAEAEVSSARSRRVVRGTVSMSRFQYDDPVGGMLAIRGQLESRSGVTHFQVAYDGEVALRLRPEAKILLRGDLHYGGDALLEGSSTVLVINELLAAQPFAAARKGAAVTFGGEETVADVRCQVVEIERDGELERWSFGINDRYSCNSACATSYSPIPYAIRPRRK